jgi:hypothetical protein
MYHPDEWHFQVKFWPVRLATGERASGYLMRRRRSLWRWEYRYLTLDEYFRFIAHSPGVIDQFMLREPTIVDC